MSMAYTIAGVVCLLIAAGAAEGADFTVHPSLAVSEEFTDNVFETETGRVSDFITRAMPGIALASKSPALEADLNYFYDYRYYARRTRSTDTTHDLLAKAHLTAVKNLLFFDLDDQYQRVSLDVTRDVTRESLFLNQEDRNVLTASPYVTLHPGARTTLHTGYRFIDTRYFDSSTGIDKTDHNAFLEASYEISPKWFATGGYTFVHQENRIDDFDQHQPYAGFLYVYADKTSATVSTPSTSAGFMPFVRNVWANPVAVQRRDLKGSDAGKSLIFGQVGYSWFSYGSGRRFNDVYWNAGVSHAFAAASITINGGVRYDEDPLSNIIQETFFSGTLEKGLNRGSVGLSLYYSEFAQNTTDILQTRKYGGLVQGRCEFTPRLGGTVAFTAEKYDEELIHTYTRRFLVESGLDYLLAEQLTVSLGYIFVDYYSPGIATDNKTVNRALLTVKKVF